MSMNRVIFQRRQAKVKKKYRLRQGFHGRNGPGALIRRLFASFIFAIVAVDSLLSDQNTIFFRSVIFGAQQGLSTMPLFPRLDARLYRRPVFFNSSAKRQPGPARQEEPDG